MSSIAPPGQIWVCCACGKTSPDRFGGPNASVGWDESCMLNASLFEKSRLVYGDGIVGQPDRVRKINQVEAKNHE